jgi:hypothetical protein
MTNALPTSFESDGEAPLVWYAGYGSNLDVGRFTCYVAGGIPVGGARTYDGCADKTPPRARVALEIPHSLYFAGESRVWTGGAAFVEHETGDTPTRVSAYLITLAQFEQVVAQENWRDEAIPVDLHKLKELGRITINDGLGNYDEMMYCGEHDSFPVVSFTSPMQRQDINRPAPAYVRMLASGLTASHRMSVTEIVDYLQPKPGITGAYSADELVSILA